MHGAPNLKSNIKKSKKKTILSQTYNATLFLYDYFCPRVCPKQIVQPNQKFIQSGISRYLGFNNMPQTDQETVNFADEGW